MQFNCDQMANLKHVSWKNVKISYAAYRMYALYWWKKNYFAEIGHFSDSNFDMTHVICLSETILVVYRTYCIVKRGWSFFDFSWWNGKSKSRSFDDMSGRIEFIWKFLWNLAQNKWAQKFSGQLNHWLSQNHLV